MQAPRPGRRQPGMNNPSPIKTDATRRRNARRTALALALVAAGIFVAFLLTAVLP